jgi:hypothetical protein
VSRGHGDGESERIGAIRETATGLGDKIGIAAARDDVIFYSLSRSVYPRTEIVARSTEIERGRREGKTGNTRAEAKYFSVRRSRSAARLFSIRFRLPRVLLSREIRGGRERQSERESAWH